MPKITKRLVDGLPLDGGDATIWDNELKGFGIRAQGKSKSYLVTTRCKGRLRKFTLGKHGHITAEAARQEAREILAEAKAGRDPALLRDRSRKSPSMKALCDRFMKDYVPDHCKDSTAAEYKRAVDLFIKPAIGTIRASEIERSDIAKFHHDLGHIPYQANRALGVLSVMFNQAEVWNIRTDGSNPCRHVKKYVEKKRERFLSPEEYQRLGKTLREIEADGTETASAINAFWLLLLTGCRLSEIQTLRWDSVFLDIGELRLADSKTGAKIVLLGDAAIDRLKKIHKSADDEDDNPYVITGKKPDSYLTDLQHPWRRIRARAGLNDVRIHDLRHSFASNAVLMGEGLPMIGKLLGHTQVQTTARYAHLANDPVRTAATRIAGSIEQALGE